MAKGVVKRRNDIHSSMKMNQMHDRFESQESGVLLNQEYNHTLRTHLNTPRSRARTRGVSPMLENTPDRAPGGCVWSSEIGIVPRNIRRSQSADASGSMLDTSAKLLQHSKEERPEPHAYRVRSVDYCTARHSPTPQAPVGSGDLGSRGPQAQCLPLGLSLRGIPGSSRLHMPKPPYPLPLVKTQVHALDSPAPKGKRNHRAVQQTLVKPVGRGWKTGFGGSTRWRFTKPLEPRLVLEGCGSSGSDSHC